MKRLLPLLLILVLASPAAVAKGEDPGAMANRAMVLFKDTKTQNEALALYQDALARATGRVRIEIMKNLGKAYGSLSAYPEAWAYLHFAFLAEGGADMQVRNALDFVTRELEKTHVKVRIEAQPPGAVVRFGDPARKLRFRTPVFWWFKPGRHEVHVSKTDCIARTAVLDIKRGKKTLTYRLKLKQKRLPIKKEPIKKLPAEKKPLPVAGPAEKVNNQVRRVPGWKWGLFGGGLVLMAGGGATWLIGWDKGKTLNSDYDMEVGTVEERATVRAEFDDAWDSQVKPFQYISYGLWGLGAAAAITGFTLILTDGGPPKAPGPEPGPAATAPRIMPILSGHGDGFILGMEVRPP